MENNNIKPVVYTTLRQIMAFNQCGKNKGDNLGLDKLLQTIGYDYDKDEPIYFDTILRSNGIRDTLWAIRATDKKWHNLWTHFACDCAEMVEYLITDERSKNTIMVARKHADGLATDEELYAAWDAARDATLAALDADWAAAKAAGGSARAARVARFAAGKLLIEYCRTGERVDWLKFFNGKNPMDFRKE